MRRFHIPVIRSSRKMKLMEIGTRVLAGLLFLCIVCGIILLMCESEDWNTQRLTLLGGFGLFMIGAIPSLIISSKGRRFHGCD